DLDRDPTVDYVEVLRGRLELFGGDLEQLAARLAGGFDHGAAAAVRDLAAARGGAERRGRGVGDLDAHLVGSDAERLRRQDREPRRGAADVGRADRDGDRAVGVDAAA